MIFNKLLAKELYAALALMALCVPGARAQAPDYSKLEFKREQLADNLYVLMGAGGNVAALTGPDGTLLVDDEIVEVAAKLRAAVALLAEKPTRFVLNTHFHFDHAGGNESFGRSGSTIIAHENVRKHLPQEQVIEAVGFKSPPTAKIGLPIVTFADGISLHLNGQDIRFIHAANAHTDSDAFVFFEQANVLHTGDLYMSLGYPLIDGGNGGTVDGLIAAHEKALALCNDATRIIPGHGPIVKKADLQAYHDMLVTVRDRVKKLVKQKKSQDQTLDAKPTQDLDARYGQGFIKPDVFVRIVYIDQQRALRRKK
jgi:cyclase